MCTVTFIPVKDAVYITSNRDEKLSRKKAAIPAAYQYNGCRLLGPVDADAGGSWIALKENGDAAVLLNGAFIPHIPQPPYRLSRGIVFLDLLTAPSPFAFFPLATLDSIEPFTFILFEKGCLYQFRWDGQEKFIKELPADQPHIWSSVTLYNAPVINKRETWFTNFIEQHPSPAQENIIHFHQFTGDGDKANDLQMSRDNRYATVSITGIHLSAGKGTLLYKDLSDKTFATLHTAIHASALNA
jgi:Transport and Golgi organisation 2